MNLQSEEFPLKEQIDRSNDPYYLGLFWCYEAQQYFRWQEMQDWYKEQESWSFDDAVYEELIITGA